MHPSRFILTVVVLAALSVALAVPARSEPGEGQLRSRIQHGKQRERALGGAVARLGALVATAERQVRVLEGRLSEVQIELAGARDRLRRTQAAERRTQLHLAGLRKRLRLGRAVLAQQLLADYKGDRPDIISVVLGADSFSALIERVTYAHRVRERSARIVGDVRSARDRTRRDVAQLARLSARRREDAVAIGRREAALSEMTGALRTRRDAFVRARAARATALANAASGRRGAQRALNRLLAARAAAARRAARAQPAAGVPSGGWAIPWPVVQCESGGQNLPPNSASASGYYQILDDTWSGLGGSTHHAFQASKAEQDRLAGQLWARGAGAHNWVCAALVG
jgi:peptidoglycan hydrolase CwlO-like protein